MLLTKGNVNRKVTEIGYSLWNNAFEETTQMIPEEVALALYADANLGE